MLWLSFLFWSDPNKRIFNEYSWIFKRRRVEEKCAHDPPRSGCRAPPAKVRTIMRQKSCVMKNKRIKLTKFENWMSSNIHECNREYSKLNILKRVVCCNKKLRQNSILTEQGQKIFKREKITHFVRKMA